MSTSTTTIRVSKETRDLLAEQARERGMSLSAMLGDLAHRERLMAVFRAEREAARADRENRGTADEAGDWDATSGDGVG